MKNIKTFCKDNKDKIVTVGCVIGVAVIGLLVYNQSKPKVVDNPFRGKDVISWVPTDRFINLETVKDVLDLNADNNSSFAIFREGVNKDNYTCILLSADVITDKPEEA